MSEISVLEPKRVFYYFEQLSLIPRGSGNTDRVGAYLETFALEHGLDCYRDDFGNVIIKKPATRGYEQIETVILQGHCDMVCEKTAGSKHDFTVDPLKLAVDGDWLYAVDTTLGADDGIAIAIMLAILESSEIEHPALEAVITTDEEVGLLGATALDCSRLNGRYLLNLDSEEEGKLLCGCAGGMTGISEIPMQRREESGCQLQIRIDGLKGGHSGNEINQNRANANILAGRLLYRMQRQFQYSIMTYESGQKDNAIPREALLMILCDQAAPEAISALAGKVQKEWRDEYAGSDDAVTITVSIISREATCSVLTPSSLQRVLFYLVNIPNGVRKMSGQIPGLVETSMNLGIVRLDPGRFIAISSIRSSHSPSKETLSDQVCYLTEFLGGTYNIEGAYPAWEYREDSKLRKLMLAVYSDLFHEKMEAEVIHAGLECGLFYDKIPGLDCVSYGPNMTGIHTTEERLSVSSVSRIWTYTLSVLSRMKEIKSSWR